MKHKTLLVFFPLLFLAIGCASTPEPPPTSNKVPPKKSVSKKPGPQNPPIAQPAQPKVTPGPKTYAIDNSPSSFKDEGQLPNFRAEPLTPPPAQAPQTPPAPGSTTAPNNLSPQSAIVTPSTQAAPATFSSIKLEDAAIPAGTSPAVLALVTESDRDRNKGDLDASVVVMERALRLDSRNPTLTYKLAQLRIKQGKPQLAEELAGKAALLAGKDLDLKRKSWLLIAEARHLQHDNQGAKEAKNKAESFFGH